MTGYVLDCCTLLNLYCGWGGIQKLGDFGLTWCIGNTALAEAKYVREFDPDGSVRGYEISPDLLFSQHRLTHLSPAGEVEAELMVKLANHLDDGEAEGLALATTRGFTFCSDDRPVITASQALGLSVSIISTPELLMQWADTDATRLAQLPTIVRRISALARFTPHKSSRHLPWWRQTSGQQQ